MILDSKERIDYYTKIGAYPNVTVNSVLKDTVHKYPDKLALADASNKEKFAELPPDRYTYRELDDAIDRLATGFLEMGIGKDDIVVLQLPNITEHVIISFALWRIGAITAPVIMQFRAHELNYIIGLSEAKAIITMPLFNGFDHVELAEKLKSEFPTLAYVISLDEIRNMMFSGKIDESALKEIEVDPNDLIQINWTSGTEANPKGCPKSHNHWMSMLNYCGVAAPQMTSEDVVLCPFPLQYISGTLCFLTPALLVGATCLLHHPFDPIVFLQQVNDEKVTYSGGSPAMHLILLNHPEVEKYSIKSLRCMMTGSAPTPEFVVKTYLEKYGVEMINFWGQNEMTGFPAGPKDVPDPYRRALTFPNFGKKGVKWNTEGSEYIETRILDDYERDLSNIGDVGELVFKSPSTLPCYFKNPEFDERAFVGGFFRTGDYFKIEENNLLTFYGRKKDIIIRGGQNVSPEELENIIQSHPKVLEVAVVGYPDPKMGEKACAYVAPRKGETISLEEIVDFMKQQGVAIFKLPERLEIVENLPRNAAGKVQKKILREDINLKIGKD
ncbi:MAG: acyl--CoA ligase [Deltaproteobacteria bacterium]|nr:acyl--CoA ligase [Deltaproteobacteria bacterium]